ncbi:MAG: Bug family tripartite tricarboxylate transporter substrate binding protein [Rhodospirillales bacterium]
MTIRRLLIAAAAAAALVPAAAAAQAWPTKPIRILLGFAPGGAQDLVGRLLADHLAKALGQPTVVESKAGAGGVVAGQILAAAPADGHTLYVVGFGIIATARAMLSSMTYDPATAFAPVTTLVTSPQILQVSGRKPVATYAEFVAFARANSGKLNHGSPGVGTQPHLLAELFKQRIGFESQHIVYRGQGPYINAMIQGEIEWGFGTSISTVQFQKGGHARSLAVTTPARWSSFPDVPTMGEAGMDDAVWANWIGLVAPAGTPGPILEKIAAEVAAGFRIPENAERLRGGGYEAWTLGPAETAKFFALERERWSAFVTANNIKSE